MFELGKDSAKEHYKVGQYLNKKGNRHPDCFWQGFKKYI
jgi:hypothetical protein